MITVIELINWLKKFQENRRLVNVAAGKDLEFSDIGLVAPDEKDPDLFN
jgi:hypothetical protein